MRGRKGEGQIENSAKKCPKSSGKEYILQSNEPKSEDQCVVEKEKEEEEDEDEKKKKMENVVNVDVDQSMDVSHAS